jgi:hypothetical protein
MQVPAQFPLDKGVSGDFDKVRRPGHMQVCSIGKYAYTGDWLRNVPAQGYKVLLKV